MQAVLNVSCVTRIKPIDTSHLSQRVENLIEEQQYLSLGYFGYVIHALACIVPHSCILIGEACEHRWYNFTQVWRNSFLYPRYQRVLQVVIATPYRS